MPEVAAPSIRIRDAAASTRVRVQSLALDVRSACSLNALSGRPLPAAVGDTVQGAARALCIGPADWILVSRELDAQALRTELCADSSTRYAIVDVSDAVATLEVNGVASRILLASACGLDLHPQAFRAGQCARTRLADIAVIIDCLDDAGRFELHVSRSYAAWLTDWLEDAAQARAPEKRRPGR